MIYEGNTKFDRKSFDGASSSYLEALKMNDKDFTAHYNLANSLYKREKYEEAKAEYQKAQKLAKTLNDKAAALYNLGNAHMKTNNHEKAAEYYKQALKQDPYNQAVRKNYEIAKLKEKQDQQNKQNKSGGGGEGKDRQQSDKGKGNQQGGQGGNQQGQGSQGNQPDPDKIDNKGSNMPKDQQDAIMKKVEGRERETARKILNKNSYSMPQSNEKDW